VYARSSISSSSHDETDEEAIEGIVAAVVVDVGELEGSEEKGQHDDLFN
jgi:hypothetical protein